MAGNTSNIAYSGLDRRPNGDARDAVCAVVVMVRVLVAVLEFGVTDAGLKEQAASAGSPLHEKLIGLVNEPCGVTVSVNVPDCPAVTVAVVGLEVNEKAAAFTVCVNNEELLPALFASPL
jgi:hypothetical protein